jgi:hypothetical protein
LRIAQLAANLPADGTQMVSLYSSCVVETSFDTTASYEFSNNELGVIITIRPRRIEGGFNDPPAKSERQYKKAGPTLQTVSCSRPS